MTSEQMLKGYGFKPQVAFKGGQVVPSTTGGSVRPDLYSEYFKMSVDSKNYNLQNPQGRSSLMQNLLKQVPERNANLPAGTRQGIILDTRGQSIEQKWLDRLLNRIEGRAGVDKENVIILGDEDPSKK